MEFKGTKGEWRMMVGGFTTKGNIPNMIQIYATNEDLEMVCKVYKDGLLHQREQYFEANAKLITCAPEMLEMLIRCSNINSIAKEHISEDLFIEIESLIKKATT